MKEKAIKKEEYVRTTAGTIDKVVWVDSAEEERKRFPKNPYRYYWKNHYTLAKLGYRVTDKSITKHGKKIEDVLEDGDLVEKEGKKIVSVITHEMYDKIVYIPDKYKNI